MCGVSVCRLSLRAIVHPALTVRRIWMLFLGTLVGFQGKGRSGGGGERDTSEPPAKTCNRKLQPNCRSYVATWRIQETIWFDTLSTAIPHFVRLLWCLLAYLCVYDDSRLGRDIFNYQSNIRRNFPGALVLRPTF